MIDNPGFYLVAIPAVILIGLSKGGFGGPIALIGVPMMSLVISPIQAAGILLPILVVMDITGLWAYRGKFHKESLVILVPAAIVGIFIGWLTASIVSENHVRLLVGVISFIFSIDYWLFARKKIKPAQKNIPKGAFWGAVAGFTSFVSHTGGPPYQMYMLPLRLDKILYAGTAVIFFACVNAVKLFPYFLLGQFSTQNLTTSAILLPLAPLALLLGVWLVRKVNQETFYKIAYLGVFLISLKLIWDGLTPWL